MKHNIKYTKNVLWLKPFVDEVSNLVPLNKIISIRGYKVPKGLEERSYGSTVKHDDKYSINIKIYNFIDKKHRPSSVSMILDILAHELAHTKIFDHRPKQYELTCRIALKFSRILEKNGIIDTSMGITNN